jgi:hypothetical protein
MSRGIAVSLISDTKFACFPLTNKGRVGRGVFAMSEYCGFKLLKDKNPHFAHHSLQACWP